MYIFFFLVCVKKYSRQIEKQDKIIQIIDCMSTYIAYRIEKVGEGWMHITGHPLSPDLTRQVIQRYLTDEYIKKKC